MSTSPLVYKLDFVVDSIYLGLLGCTFLFWIMRNIKLSFIFFSISSTQYSKWYLDLDVFHLAILLSSFFFNLFDS